MTGSGNHVSGWSLFPTSIVELTDTKDATVRRTRPRGIELLFNGTNVSAYKNRYNIGTYMKITPLTGGGWSGVVGLVNGNVSPGRTASPPFGATYSTSEWSNQLRKKLVDASVSIGMMFAEYRQTAAMFTDFSSRLLGAYRAIRSGDPYRVYSILTRGGRLPKGWKRRWSREISRSASESWLAFQYGIKPLISDLAGAIDEYYKARSVIPLIRRVSFRLPEKGCSDTVRSGVLNDYTDDFAHVSLVGRLTCFAEFESDIGAFDQTAQRLGLTNPALLLWELIPWSFVIDWFLNVGEFLAACESVKGLKRVGIHVTSKYQKVSSRMYQGGLGTAKEVQSKRLFYSALPAPTLNFGKGLSSWQRSVSALALIRGAFPSSTKYPSRR